MCEMFIDDPKISKMEVVLLVWKDYFTIFYSFIFYLIKSYFKKAIPKKLSKKIVQKVFQKSCPKKLSKKVVQKSCPKSPEN